MLMCFILRKLVEEATERTSDKYTIAIMTGDNVREGVSAFRERREPVWVDSKL